MSGKKYVIQNGGDPEAWLTGAVESVRIEFTPEGQKKRGRKPKEKPENRRERLKTWCYRREIREAMRFDDLWEAWTLAQRLHAKVYHIQQNSVQEEVNDAEILEARMEKMKREQKEDRDGTDRH